MKKPTVKQSVILDKKLNLNYEEWLIKRWNTVKGGSIEICLVNRESGEKIKRIVSK